MARRGSYAWALLPPTRPGFHWGRLTRADSPAAQGYEIAVELAERSRERKVGCDRRRPVAPRLTIADIAERERMSESRVRWVISEARREMHGAGVPLSTIYDRVARQQRVRARAGRRCVVCGELIDPGKRAGTQTCSQRCRTEKSRRGIPDRIDEAGTDHAVDEEMTRVGHRCGWEFEGPQSVALAAQRRHVETCNA